MFDPTSRYYKLPITKIITPDGRTISYVRRRILPKSNTLQILGEIAVEQGDRLDHVTFRTLGDSQQFWQICDANSAMKPADLTVSTGKHPRILRIPTPQG